MKLMEFTAYGVADEYAAITINLDNVNAIYASEANTKKGNTTINYSNGTWTYLRESYVEVMEAIRKAYG
jgi:hypothetical protein